tara:strand:- start:188 stop:640 length:453 start_codon:yes stop_codon:yes gene_type:complete
MSIYLQTSDDDYQNDIVFGLKNRFEPSLSKEELNNIDQLFCIDSMANSRVFASNRREIRLTYKYRQMFNLEKGYTVKDICDNLQGIELAFIRRRVVDGVKIDNDFVIDKGIFKDIQGVGMGWDYTNIILDINGNEIMASPQRIFYPTQKF